MQLVFTGDHIDPAKRRFEVVERKGLGHPDTLADLIAEVFSRLYSRYTRERFGVILNHAVDKVTLVGISANVRFGGWQAIQAGRVMLIGNITPAVDSRRIPIHEIFRETVATVFSVALTGSSILPHLSLEVVNTYSSAADRPKNFFLPDSSKEAEDVGEAQRGANDTVFCTATAPRTPLEMLVCALEQAVTGPSARATFPDVGTDVKVLARRLDDAVTVTACIPVLPERADSKAAYLRCLGPVEELLTAMLRDSGFNFTLQLNTKDHEGGAYLAPFGTALGKSDCGAVGRGNRRTGVISAFGPTNIEAPAGKNPLHHVGKLFMETAMTISAGILSRSGVANSVTIATSNGLPIDAPESIVVDLPAEYRSTPERRHEMRAICEAQIREIPKLGHTITRSALCESGWTILEEENAEG